MKFIATFGQGQFGGVLKDACITFDNATDLQVRHWMSQKHHFNGVWCGTYSGEAMDSYIKDYAPRSIACVSFDEPSNDPFAADRYTVHTKEEV